MLERNDGPRSLETPGHLDRDIARELLRARPTPLERHEISIGELELQRMDLILEILNNEELFKLIDEGRIGFGFIRPIRQGDSRIEGSDEEVAAQILERLEEESELLRGKAPFKVIFHVSPQMRRDSQQDDVSFFYKHVEDILKKKKINGRSQWQAFRELLASGPITAFLVYDPEGEVVDKLRTLVGDTNPKKAAKGTIRADFAKDLRNNIIHASDSPENVKREITWLRDTLERWREKLVSESPRRGAPTEEELKTANVIPEDGRLIVADQVQPFRTLAPTTYRGVSRIIYADEKDERHSIDLVQIVVESSRGPVSPESEFTRMKLLQRIGFPVPRAFGVVNNVLYREWIPGGDTPENMVIGKAKLRQLIRIAAILDVNGFELDPGIPFIFDLLYKGNRFYFIGNTLNLGMPDPARWKEAEEGKEIEPAADILRSYYSGKFGDYLQRQYENAKAVVATPENNHILTPEEVAQYRDTFKPEFTLTFPIRR